MRPKGSGGAGASAALALLDDIPVSPAARRLASAPAALGTRPIVLSPRAASVPSLIFVEQIAVLSHLMYKGDDDANRTADS